MSAGHAAAMTGESIFIVGAGGVAMARERP